MGHVHHQIGLGRKEEDPSFQESALEQRENVLRRKKQKQGSDVVVVHWKPSRVVAIDLDRI